jgi:hypothetical protein
MITRNTALLTGLLVLAADGLAQVKPQPSDPTAEVRALRQELAAARRQVALARTRLAAEDAARQDLAAQLNALKAQQGQISALAKQVEALAREVRSLKANSVLDLNGYLTYDTSNGYPVALFRGINVQIVNGTGRTQSATGLGNLIVGYDQASAGSFICSLGTAESEADCRSAGGVWAQSHKSGSHNIVGGDFNSYSSWGGIVLGAENAILGPYASVLGGARNRAGSSLSSIAGGSYNTTTGIYGTVGGGFGNRALGDLSSVSGGAQRISPGAQDWAAGSLIQDQ